MNEKAVTAFVALLAFSLLTWSIVAKAKPITEAEKRLCGRPWIERCGPGLYVCDVFETTRQRLEQLLLLS
jgi:hypothetical protein